jgi:hypothetical protein
MMGINLVIFCKKTYKDFLPYCTYSIDKYVKDDIITKTIISEENFSYQNYQVIADDYFWNLIDKDFNFEEILNINIFSPGWLKQQIIKLNLDKIISGDILVVDCDLLFLNDIKFVENKKYNLHLAIEYCMYYFNTIDYLLSLSKQTKLYESFITDFGIFNSSILKEIRTEIEKKHSKTFLQIILDYSKEDFSIPMLSEYELYGNYFLKNHKDKINKIISPIDYKVSIDLPNYKDYSPKEFLIKVKKNCKNHYQCVELNEIILNYVQ